jgi:hypothetical protein
VSFRKEQKTLLELRFKERMRVAQEALATQNQYAKMGEANKAKDNTGRETIKEPMESLPEKPTASGTAAKVDVTEEGYD